MFSCDNRSLPKSSRSHKNKSLSIGIDLVVGGGGTATASGRRGLGGFWACSLLSALQQHLVSDLGKHLGQNINEEMLIWATDKVHGFEVEVFNSVEQG